MVNVVIKYRDEKKGIKREIKAFWIKKYVRGRMPTEQRMRRKGRPLVQHMLYAYINITGLKKIIRM
jgi:hypothetical protein